MPKPPLQFRDMPSTNFLTLPTEIQREIYKNVFAGAELNINVTFDENEKLNITSEKCPSRVIYTACLETCSKINIEAFPIMAGAINLAIRFLNLMDTTELNLNNLTTLPYPPSFLSRILPFIIKLTYERHLHDGCCFGFPAFPNLRELRIRISQPFALEGDILPNWNNSATLARALCDKVMLRDDWIDLRELLEVSGRKFKVYLTAQIYYYHRGELCLTSQVLCL